MGRAHRTFLAEIGTEELPPLALRGLMDAFRAEVCSGLGDAGLGFGMVTAYASPRRLAVMIEGLAPEQPDRAVEHRGPPVKVAFDESGQPTRAAEGFARTHGTDVAGLERLTTDKGEWLLYRAVERGLPAARVMPGIVETALQRLPIPRRMRWGAGDEEFVRPVHWVVMMLDGEVVPATLFGMAAGRETWGHRVHAPDPLSLEQAGDYPAVLASRGKVLADFDRRRQVMLEQVESAAQDTGGKPVMNDTLLDEVTALVEWPVALTGSFPERYLALPEEVLVATLQAHQRYFPVRGNDGTLLPSFIAVSNLESTHPEQVRRGNERVIRPRLADAQFFFDADRQTSLEARLPGLAGVTFQAELGSVLDKTRRVEALTGILAAPCGADADAAGRAALLARCDLVTGMVGEFPELQGIMGRHYAAAGGEAPEICEAIGEFYQPRFAGDALPESPAGTAVSLADKIDTLAGIFAIGQPPTGTRDPFGLRRAALGVMRIIVESSLELDLAPVLDRAIALLPPALRKAGLADAVLDYMLERLRAYYMEGRSGQGVTTEMFDAVLARRPTRPLDFHRRLLAVRDFMGDPAAEALASANKRIGNILRKAGEPWPPRTDPALLSEPAERDLHKALMSLTGQVGDDLGRGAYADALNRLARLREPVDRFFDDVMVMSEDPRARGNRLALLDGLHQLFSRIADFSRLSPG